MSQIHLTANTGSENQLHHRNVKQFGVSGKPRSTIKKTALTDVKNILAQRSAQSAKKPLSSTTKATILKRDLFGVHHDKENLSSKNNVGTSDESKFTCSSGVLIDQDTNVHSACSYCNSNNDDDAFADFMMKGLTLTKSQIDKFALEWETKPVFGIKDMRPMEELPAAIPEPHIDWPSFDSEMNEPDIDLLMDLPPMVQGLYDSENEE